MRAIDIAVHYIETLGLADHWEIARLPLLRPFSIASLLNLWNSIGAGSQDEGFLPRESDLVLSESIEADAHAGRPRYRW